MNNNKIKIAGISLGALLGTLLQAADAPTFQLTSDAKITTYGYLAGQIDYSKVSSQATDTNMDLVAAKLGFGFDFKPVTGNLSFFYANYALQDVNVLEANITYDVGNGLTLTGGRYLSWIGYEAFDVPDQLFLTFGFDGFGATPGFYEGVRAEYAFGDFTVGLGFNDSINDGYYWIGSANGLKGDGNLDDGYAFEGKIAYSKDALSGQLTLAWEHSKHIADAYSVDIWGQYNITDKTTVGAEFYYKDYKGVDSKATQRGYYGLVFAKQQLCEKLSVAGRVAYGKDRGVGIPDYAYADGSYVKVSVSPAYEVTPHLSFAAEVTYVRNSKDVRADVGGQSAVFAGVLGIFKF
jgi:hypothetical protein